MSYRDYAEEGRIKALKEERFREEVEKVKASLADGKLPEILARLILNKQNKNY